MKNNGITEYFEEVETEEEYNGYFCRIPEIITIAILGSMCGLKNVSQIHQWASNDRVSEFLREKFGINHVPCYYWILCMLKMIKTETLNRCFANWVYSFMPENAKDMTISLDGKTISTTNTMKINNISNLMLHHKYPYTPEEPIETVPSRAFTGIIIDARGAIPVHGEYIKSNVYPCFFPMIWDSEMNLIYEKNISDRKKAETDGIVYYHYSDDKSLYENRIGTDPLYIKATKVYGRNRTDPVIKQKDALKILTVPENKKLLKEGKIVILLDKENLIYDIKIPQKDPSYYATFNELKKYNYNPEDNIKITDSLPGILFSVDLKFIPDSPRLLPAEKPRIAKIAEMLSEIINKDEFTILIEGHTADIGKPIGQMNLSIERTKTIRDALIQEGIPEKLFSYKGYGGTRPIATNQTEEGRAQNRRVNIIARPKATYIQRDW